MLEKITLYGSTLLCVITHTACPADELVCSESPTDSPVCIAELQLCDGVTNCPNGSDESEDICVIPPGDCITTFFFLLL